MNPVSENLPKIALVGVTGWAKTHLEGIRHLVESGEAQWSAVTIINPSDAQEAVEYFNKNNVRIYKDYYEMLEKEHDSTSWVSIPTGIGHHAPMAVAALNNGVPAFIEKPLAATLSEVELIQEAESRAGLQCAVGFQHMYLESTSHIRSLILDGAIGPLKRINFLGLWPRPVSYYSRNNWAGRIHDGKQIILDSPLNNAFSHGIALMLQFARQNLESITVDHVEAETYRTQEIENYDTIWTKAITSNGIPLTACLSHSSVNLISPEIRIEGESGTIVWRWFGTHSFISKGRISSIPEVSNSDLRQQVYSKVNRFLVGQSNDACKTKDALPHTLWVNAVQDCAIPHDIPEKFSMCFQKDEQTFKCISGIEYWAIRSIQEGKSFYELRTPWAIPAASLSTRGYRGYSIV